MGNTKKILAAFLGAAVLYAVPAHAGNAALKWGAPTTNSDGSALSDLAGYKVYYGTASGSYSSSVNVGNVTSYSLSLPDGLTYYFAVTAYNSSGAESGYSNEGSKTMQSVDNAGPVISGVYAASVASSSASINWVTDEQAYGTVEYGLTSSYGYTSQTEGTPSTAHAVTLSGLAAGKTYNYRVASRDAAGNVSYSGNYTFNTAAPSDTTAPAISNIVVENITGSTATVTWATDEGSTAQVEYGTSASYGSATDLAPELTAVHTVTLTGLAANTQYHFAVRSADAAGNSAVSPDSTFTTSNSAPLVNSFAASKQSGNAPLSVTFSASASDSDGTVTNYEWDVEGDGVYDVDTGVTPSYTHTYSQVGTYSARVRVRDNGGATVESDAQTITVTSVNNEPPVVETFSGSPEPSTRYSIRFDLRYNDPNGTIVRHEWDFDGNGVVDAEAAPPVSHVYPRAGTYNPVVTLTDNQGGVVIARTMVTVTDEGAGGTSPSPAVSGSTPSSSGGSGGCFIATAAYGSYLEPEVMVLRAFRDDVLLTNPVGRSLVDFYYRVSPPVADVIARHRPLKIATRLVLTPVVYGMKYPGVSLGLFAAFFSAVIARRSRR